MAKKNNFQDLVNEAQSDLRPQYANNGGGEYSKLNTSFNPAQTNMSRYLTYGSKVYGELGFDPTRNNDAFYNDNTSGLEDISRAFQGFFKLTKVGFTDTFAFGIAKDKSSSYTFEKIMGDYSSTREKTLTGFISNTMLSSGYTAGILAAIAAEEIILTGATVLSGGTAAPLQLAESGRVLARGAQGMNQSRRVIDGIRAAGEIENARSIFSKIYGFAKPLNPLENTIDFAIDAYKGSENIKNYSKAVVGAGAMVRDMRKIYMSHSESKLEAEMGEREFFNKMYNEAVAKSQTGRLSEQELEDIKQRSKEVYNKIYTGNFGLIYATNAIAFDNMFKTMKGLTHGNSILDNGLYRANRTGSGVTFEALRNPVRGIRKHLLDQGREFASWKGWSKAILSGSMEGIQEVGQDIISTGTQSYYQKHKITDQTKGGFLSNAYDDLMHAAKDMWSYKGFETFMSGALMGVFASPVGLSTKAVNSFLFEGGVNKAYQKITNNKDYAEMMNKDFVSRQDKAKLLTEFYNNSKNFIDFVDNPLLEQQALQEQMAEASRKGDVFSFKNAQEKAFAEGIWTIMENGLEDHYKEHLDYMASQFNVKELQEVFGRPDITESNASEFKQKLKDRVSKIDQYKKHYDEVNLNFKNPISMQGLSAGDEGFLEKYLEFRAYDSLRKDMVVSLGAIDDYTKRIEELREELRISFDFNNAQEFSQVYDSSSMSSEINMLKNNIKSTEGLDLDIEALERQNKDKERLSLLEKYYNTFQKFEKELLENKISVATQNELYDNLKALIGKEKSAGYGVENKYKLAYDKLVDFMYMGAQMGHLKNHTSALSFFDSQKVLAEKRKGLMMELEKNKETHILNALKEFEIKKESDAMLNELYEAGLFFHTRELDDLLKAGEMPSEIYDIANNTVATREQRIKAQEIINKTISNLKNKDLLEYDPRDRNKVGRKKISDNRTVEDIFTQYGIKENSVIDFSTDEGYQFLEDLIEKGDIFLADLAVLEKIKELGLKDFKLKFVTNQDSAIKLLDNEKTYSIDVRFSAEDYNAGKNISFESLVIRALTQEMISTVVVNSEILEQIMLEVREALKEVIPVDMLPEFNEPKLFLSEVLNNPEMQNYLEDVKLSVSMENESAWSDFVSGISGILSNPSENFEYTGNTLKKITALLITNPTVETITEITDSESGVVDASVSSEKDLEDMSLDELLALNLELFNEEKKITSQEKISVRDRRTVLNIGIKRSKILDLINIKRKELADSQKEEIGFRSSDENYSPDYGNYGIELISIETPWNRFPQELKEQLLKEVGLDINKAKTDDLVALFELIKEDVTLQQIITNYNHKVEEEAIKKANELNKENPIVSSTAKTSDEIMNQIRNERIKKVEDTRDEMLKQLYEENKDLLVTRNDVEYGDRTFYLKGLSYTNNDLRVTLFHIGTGKTHTVVIDNNGFILKVMSASGRQFGELVDDAQVKFPKEFLENLNFILDTTKSEIETIISQTVSKKEKVKNTIQDNLKNFLKEDYDLFTEKEIQDILNKLQNSKNSIIPFTFNDVRDLVKEKKLQQAIKEQREKLKEVSKSQEERLKAQKEIKKEIRTINRNINSLTIGKQSFQVKVGNKVEYIKVNLTEELLGYIQRNYPSIFKLNPEEFKVEFRKILQLFNSNSKNYSKYIKGIPSVEAIDNFILELAEKKELTPELVRKINNRLVALNHKMILKMNPNSILGYDYVSTKRKASSVEKRKTTLQKQLLVIKDYIDSSGIGEDLRLEALVAFYINNYSFTKETIEKMLFGEKIPVSRRKSYTTTKGKLSVVTSEQEFADKILENEKVLDELDAAKYIWETFKDFVQKHSSPSKAIAEIYNKILDFQNTMEENEYQYEASEETEKLQSIADEISFLDSQAGKDYLKEQEALDREYKKSIEYEILFGKFDGDMSKLNTDELKNLYYMMVAQGMYEMPVDEAAKKLSEIEDEEEDLFMKALDERDQDIKERLKDATNTILNEEFVLSFENDGGSNDVLIKVKAATINSKGNYSIVANKIRGGQKEVYHFLMDPSGKVLSFTSQNGISAKSTNAKLLIDPSLHFIRQEKSKTLSKENSKTLLNEIIENETGAEVVSESKELSALEIEKNNLNISLEETSASNRINNLLKSNLSLTALLAIYQHVDKNFKERNNKSAYKQKVLERINNLNFPGVVLDGEIYRLDSIDINGDVVLYSSDGTIFNITNSELFNSFEREALEGEVFGEDIINTQVQEAQLKYAKSLYSNIIDNFDVESIDVNQAKENLKEHIKIC